MQKELKDLVEQLGSAIDETIAESGRIGDIVQEMERAGYDLTLVLEATMRLSPKDKPEEDLLQGQFQSVGGTSAYSEDFEFSQEDQAFLQALKVAI